MSDTSARSNRTPLRGLLIFLVVVSGLVLAGVLFLRYQLSPVDPRGHTSEFEVLPGWGASRVAEALADAGLIRQAQLFSLWLRYKGLDRGIGEGLYDLSPAMSAPELARTLAAGGRPRVARVVIPEGFRAVDVAARLAATGFGDEAILMKFIQEPGALRPEYIPEDAGLEGYLFPASYEIPVRSRPEEALAVILARFGEELTPEVEEALKARNLSVHAWVTLASLVQSEAGNLGEMPIIAGIFLNRLDEGMLLQSDPTVVYGLGKPMTELEVAAGDLEADHPWNTYLYPGLPRGPISNPGHDALRAVLEPQRLNPDGKPYLYFLHDRELVFRPNLTLEDHERDVRQHLR